MIESTRIYIGLVVKFIPEKLRKDYKSFVSEILSENGYTIESMQVFSDRIELSLSSLNKSPSIIERELTSIGSRIENGLSVESTTTSINSKRDLRVFLCHSQSDKPTVEKFYNFLVKDGVDAWLDKKNLIPGQNWQVEIPKAVRNSDIVIVFLSSQSVTKEGFVQKEIKIALDTADEKPEGTIFIIPAKLENCEVPERLAKFQWVDLFEKDGYERLFKALQIRASDLEISINRKTRGLPK